MPAYRSFSEIFEDRCWEVCAGAACDLNDRNCDCRRWARRQPLQLAPAPVPRPEPRQPHRPASRVKGRPRLYFAYGSNLHAAQMQRRCPGAVQIGPLTLPNAVLRFRGVADVVWHPKASCPGGLWEITAAHERALDRYEGVAFGNEPGLYVKRYIKLRMPNGRERNCLIYQMTQGGIMPPSEVYYETIVEGYRNFGLDLAPLEMALKHAWRRKSPRSYIRRRRAARGHPVLARQPGSAVPTLRFTSNV